MITDQDFPTRRILTFPAIRPCESASPATVLSSLITLSHKICSYKSKPFYTNSQNIKNSIRIVENLLVFLEEIRRDDPCLRRPVFLSLSELHFVLQKLRFLLDDCTRVGSRVWMLVSSEKVSGHFRVLARSVSIALDVLPIDSLDVSTDVKELIFMVKSQTSKSMFGFQPEDKRVLENLGAVFKQLENQIAPDPNHLKRVLDCLGISSWSECNQEIKFFDSEIGSERSDSKNSDLATLSSLMGLLIYCRCAVFATVDGGETPFSVDRCRSFDLGFGFLNVDDFRCPITLEIMSDPVTLMTGHTYDRCSITKWFESGNLTCPKTGEKVESSNLVSNSCLKSVIKKHCEENGIPVAESRTRNRNPEGSGGGSVVAEAAIKLTADFLVGRLVFGTDGAKQKAECEIRLLAKTSGFNRRCLVEAGVIPNLLDLLGVESPEIQENAIAALLNLSKYSEAKRIVVENGGLELIIDVVQNGMKLEARQHAAGMLFYLASVAEYRAMIGKIPRSIPALTELILDGTDRGKKNALVAIYGLLMCPENHWKVLAAGTVPLLVDNMRSASQREDLVADSLSILATLAQKPDGSMVVLSCGALDVILKVFGSTTSRASRESCVVVLHAMCVNGGADVVRVLVANPSLMGPLYSLLTEGGSRARKKASSLIRILHEFNEKNSSSAIRRPIFFQERFINVR